MLTPYKPLELAQSDVDILDELILSKRSFGLSKSKPSLKVEFIRPSSKRDHFSFTCSLNINQQQVDLALEPAVSSFLAKRFKELGGLESLPAEFHDSLIALSSKEVIDALEALFQVPVALWESGHNRETELEKKSLFFKVLNDQSAVEAYGKITLSLELIEKIISLAAQLPTKEITLLSGCVLKGEICIGHTTIASDSWQHLSAGAFLFLDEPSALMTGQGNFLLKHGEEMTINIDQEKLQALIVPLQEVSSSGVSSFIASPEEDQQKEEEKRFIQENSLETSDLVFSVGTLSLSIEEIINLATTPMLDYSIDFMRPVKILVQGEKIGAGEIVEINGRYALFITQLSL